MGRALLILRTAADKAKAISWITKAPFLTRVEFKASKRTLPQNDRFWAMLTELSEQGEHCGRKYSVDDWKLIVLAALGKETRFVPSLDGASFIPIGRSSSDLSIEEMSDAIEIMFSWGADHGVKFCDPASLIGVTPETLERESAERAA